jgi:hypothetical protein
MEKIKINDDGVTAKEILPVKIEETKEVTESIFQGTKNDIFDQKQEIIERIERLEDELGDLEAIEAKIDAELAKLPERVVENQEIKKTV